MPGYPLTVSFGWHAVISLRLWYRTLNTEQTYLSAGIAYSYSLHYFSSVLGSSSCQFMTKKVEVLSKHRSNQHSHNFPHQNITRIVRLRPCVPPFQTCSNAYSTCKSSQLCHSHRMVRIPEFPHKRPTVRLRASLPGLPKASAKQSRLLGHIITLASPVISGNIL